MKFTTLIINNFLSIENAVVQLADRGLVLIQGVNEDNSSAHSNGSGKSSVADALCWCLYGSTARGVSGDAVVNRSVGKETLVSVRLEDGAAHYSIERYRKSKINKNALRVYRVEPTGSLIDLTKGTDKLTQEAVDQIVGSSYDVFRAAVYAGQESMPDLPSMTDKQLKVLVEEAAGVTILEKAYSEALLEARQMDDKIARMSSNIMRLEEQAKELHESLGDNCLRQAAYEAKKKIAIKNFQTDADKAEGAIKKIAAHITALDEPRVKAELAAMELKIAAVSDERNKEKALEKELRDQELMLVKTTADVKAWRAHYDRAKANLDACTSLVGTPCSECDKPFREEDIADQRDRLKLRLKEVTDKASVMKTLVEDAKKRAENARETLETYRATMTDVSAVSTHIAAQRAILDEIRAYKGDIESCRRDYDAAINQMKRLDLEKNPFEELTKEIAKKVHAKEAERDAAIAEFKILEEMKKITDDVVKVFSPSGVRAHILDEVTPFLNDQTAKYLSSLTDGHTTATWSTLVRTAKGELREKFSIEVMDATGGESFAALSGGEKRKVRIASALALQDLVARRATKPIELFIGDEIDDALDEAGLERLTSILEEKARERGSVFIISHNDIKDWAPATITVVKKAGKSVVIDEMA